MIDIYIICCIADLDLFYAVKFGQKFSWYDLSVSLVDRPKTSVSMDPFNVSTNGIRCNIISQIFKRFMIHSFPF